MKFITLAPGPNDIEFSDEEKEFYNIEHPVKNNEMLISSTCHFISPYKIIFYEVIGKKEDRY
jgi:hypothetical protein